MATPCYQVNLQRGFGGGEVYTAFFARALAALGIRSVLFAHPEAAHWRARLPQDAQVIPVSATQLAQRLAALRGAWVVFHTPLPGDAVAALHRAGASATAFAHLPLYDRNPAVLEPYDLVIPVSQHVADSLRARGLSRVHAEPLYGVADLRGRRGDRATPLLRHSVYDWDRRKLRDRLLSHAHPLLGRLRPRLTFTPRPGIALGIVSRLTPIKQFALLFRHLAPVLARFPTFHLEIFGSGGYASVRELRAALAPIRARARFWGEQREVGAAYARIDYLLTGLPEKEALGLNVLEAQACGVPVLAVQAPPFTEIVAAGVTGLFYADPRRDAGAGFAALLARLAERPFALEPAAAAAHLQKFSEAAFMLRVERLVAEVRRRGLWTGEAARCAS
ncbi:MAG: glycosyltransferase [Betaproteobacteria bacterium]|nr:MAG: glycosyltransferase [Betaproteobacteria bacterium]